MAKCRIYLLTYRRNELLRRALKSLLQQTFADWVCELHNDDPSDEYPENLVEELGDDRFIIKNHSQNLGPLKSFNLIFENCPEQYISMLEDDNWWEPDFLASMLFQMDNHPNINVCWSNMRLWREEQDGSWFNLNQTTHSVGLEDVVIYSFPNYKQAFGYLHSQGAMLIRNNQLVNLQTPTNIRLDFVEPIRERAFEHPIMLLNKPLANFAITLQTNRNKSILGINEHFFLLLGSFFRYVTPSKELIDDIWRETRNSPVRATNKLIYAGILLKECRVLLRNARISDYIYFLLYNIKRPTIFFRCVKAKKLYPDLWEYLDTHTKNRFQAQESTYT